MRPMFCISLTPGILYVQRLFERVKGIRKFSFFFSFQVNPIILEVRFVAGMGDLDKLV